MSTPPTPRRRLTLRLPLKLRPYSTPTAPMAEHLPEICGSVVVPGLDLLHIASIVAFAHLTNYSSVRIALLLCEVWPISLTAEALWDTYCEWEGQRLDRSLEEIDVTINRLKSVLAWHGVVPEWTAKPLNERGRVITLPFTPVWSPSGDVSVFEGYSNDNRQDTIQTLVQQQHDSSLANLAPFERLIATRLGKPVRDMIRKTLTSFLAFTNAQTAAAPFHTAIYQNLEPQVNVCMFGVKFMQLWEEEFGSLDDADDIQSSRLIPIMGRRAMSLRSSAHATHLFVCLVLLDRLKAMQLRRDIWRRETGFVPVVVAELAEDGRDCPICQETLGIAGDGDAEAEMPLRVVACCGNVFGSHCIRKWYGDYKMGFCPICKWNATPTFLERIREDWKPRDTDHVGLLMTVENHPMLRWRPQIQLEEVEVVEFALEEADTELAVDIEEGEILF